MRSGGLHGEEMGMVGGATRNKREVGGGGEEKEGGRER